MATPPDFDIFLMAPPGLEAALYEEVRQHRFKAAKQVAAGVMIKGAWKDVWRANLVLRGCGHVLARIGSFRVQHLAELDRLARAFPWGNVLRKDVPVRVEASCSRSKIYHSGAVVQRIARAIAEEFDAPLRDDAEVIVKARIEDDLCTLSIDSSGESLHKRGHKAGVGKAPLRETLAALFLRQCGFTGDEPVVDPMCGSGTFVIEAAEIAAHLAPGRTRSFAFEKLATFDAAMWDSMKAAASPRQPTFTFFGSDRDAGAIRMATENAKRAGVSAFTQFRQQSVSDLVAPQGPPGLVIVNPPYGARIGDKKPLFALYGALGKVLKQRFSGWRVGLITADAALARATALPFLPIAPPVLNGGLRVSLYRTPALP
ncbi:MAG: class I SAM-dependent RNA methyltransferase [Aestuariivirga sp.]|uniref:THUMP domain-containing class I SAM-dependent RNA methyltransferase n=1 Tax=Aestuariivirga sp. TaxID=2650926 RepID=UPI0025C27373|nr:class I SAM-dependent RNA methyltransferase [Aestuariivirga sp.]MCA3561561.1 class I SAM-dependent RNA methyltransferase [Aestuariivirga sp.]